MLHKQKSNSRLDHSHSDPERETKNGKYNWARGRAGIKHMQIGRRFPKHIHIKRKGENHVRDSVLLPKKWLPFNKLHKKRVYTNIHHDPNPNFPDLSNYDKDIIWV